MTIYQHDETEVGELDRRWLPVLRGDIYCSPACGGNCTKSAYDNAVMVSNRLASQLGDGWIPEVFENMGWYWKVQKGDLTVRPDCEDEADFSEADFSADLQFDLLDHSYYFEVCDPDPIKAVQLVREQLSNVIKKLERQHASSEIDPINKAQNLIDSPE